MRALIKIKDTDSILTYSVFVSKYEDLEKRCEELIKHGQHIDSVTIKLKKDMIYQRDLAEYGVSTMSEYYDIIIQQSADNMPMSKTMYRDLSAKQKQDFLDHLDESDTDEFLKSDLMIELVNNF